MHRTNRRLLQRIEENSRQLAEVTGRLNDSYDRLGLAEEYESAQRQVSDLRIELGEQQEKHDRNVREIEHKLGLHKQRITADQEIAQQRAEAERIRAVEEAKLAVREGNLDAERTRFEQEIAFRTKRFEEEARTLRDLTAQILERLPKVNVERSFQTVEHVEVDAKRAIGAGQ